MAPPRAPKGTIRVQSQGRRWNNIDQILNGLSGQLHDTHKHIFDVGLYEQFNQLPPADCFHFEDIEDNVPKIGMHPRKMYLGGDVNPVRHVWALLKVYEAKASEVYIVEFEHNGSRIFTKSYVASDPNAVQLMFPFRIFTMKRTQAAKAQLNTLIQYYFMECRELPRVWQGEAKTPLKTIVGAITTINQFYFEYPGGVDAVPLTYTPASIHAKVDAVDEGHGPDGHDSGYGASIAGPSNPQPESSRAQPELSHTQSDEDTAVIPNQLLDVADISSQASMTDGEAQAGESSKNTGKRKRPVDDGDEVPEPREHLANRPATTDAERRAEIRRLLTRTREMTARFNQEIYGPGDSGILSSHAAEPVGPVQSVSPDPDSIQVMMDRDEECIGKNFYPELGGWY